LANEVEKYLTDNGRGGVEVLLFIHELPWSMASDRDKKRIISHEMRHIMITDKDQLKIVEHDVEDFLVEIQLNATDSPDWSSKLAELTRLTYEQQKEQEEEAKPNLFKKKKRA
jgi:hypothetical protein